MCELLGMCSSRPADLCFSWRNFLLRGGDDGPHRDGFGIGFYKSDGYCAFRDTEAAATSPLAAHLGETPIASSLALGHIRQANEGAVEKRNTYPFDRSLSGRCWSFVMQGQLARFDALTLSGAFVPSGTTDGERAFCWLLDRLQKAPADLTPDEVCTLLKQHCDRLARRGVFNILISDGEVLYAYCTSSLYWLSRTAPFGSVGSVDSGECLDLSHCCRPGDCHTLLATRPLTAESGWQALHPGEAIGFRAGRRCTGCHTHEVDPL